MSEIEKKVKDDDKLNTSNIFDEFEVDEEILNEIKKEDKEKDAIYYIKNIGKVFLYVNFILFFVVVILSFYVYIEQSESDSFSSKEYLNPVCNILNGVDTSILGNCSGLNNSINQIDQLNKAKNEEILEKEIAILKKSYQINSIKNTKEALFIIDKSKNKNDPVKILNEFDILKNNFTSIDKQKIRCENISINGNILEADCSAYSTAWYKDIPGPNGEKTINTLSGTSITLASSFINFIGKSSKFTLIDKQKEFELLPYLGEGNFVYKTNFKIKAEYNKLNDLSL